MGVHAFAEPGRDVFYGVCGAVAEGFHEDFIDEDFTVGGGVDCDAFFVEPDGWFQDAPAEKILAVFVEGSGAVIRVEFPLDKGEDFVAKFEGCGLLDSGGFFRG